MLDQTLLEGHEFCSSPMPIACHRPEESDVTDFSSWSEIEQKCGPGRREGRLLWRISASRRHPRRVPAAVVHRILTIFMHSHTV